MFVLYSLIYLISLILLLPYEFIKRPKTLRKRWLREKLGGIKPDDDLPFIWLHAVSVGEVIASIPFIKAMKELYPHLSFIVSTITDTGQKVASERLSGMAEIVYLPFDIRFILKRVLRRIRPVLFITMETEIWPNVFRVMKENGVSVAILNGRISDNSFKGYKKIRFFIERVMRNVDLFCMQEPVYAERIIELGALEDKVKVTGNFKFDIRTSPQKPVWADNIVGPLIIAGSTHRAEEDLILSAFIELKKDFPSLSLLIAPRHPGRFKEVEELISSKGLAFIRRSAIAVSREALPEAMPQAMPAVILLDTIGELFSAYGISDIAIVGGSFIGHGGQNPLEPAYWGKPVVCGPHMENFLFVEDFIKKGGIVKVDKEGLYPLLKELLTIPEKQYIIGKKAKEFCMSKTGAVDRAIKAIKELCPLQVKPHGTT